MNAGTRGTDYFLIQFHMPYLLVHECTECNPHLCPCIGESRQQALIREIKEELDYSIQVEHEFLTVEHQYPDFRLLMHSYLCTAKDVNFTLIEHIDYKWLPIHQLKNLDWAAADRTIVNQLVSQKA